MSGESTTEEMRLFELADKAAKHVGACAQANRNDGEERKAQADKGDSRRTTAPGKLREMLNYSDRF